MANQRGRFNELTSYPEWVSELVKQLNGRAWNVGFESLNKRGGFHAINTDIYGYAEIQNQKLAVVQVRESFKRKSSHFLSVRKQYFLVGFNENGNPFAHAIESPIRSKKALQTVSGVVEKALCEIWELDDFSDYRLIVRNGDVAFIPVTARQFETHTKNGTEIEKAIVAESHIVTPCRDGKLFQSNLTQSFYLKKCGKIQHDKNQHPTVAVSSGQWLVMQAIKFTEWDFSSSTVD